jgi:hypothetical protein
MMKVENLNQEFESPKYFIVRDNYQEYLVKRERGRHTFMLRAQSREEIYQKILADLTAPVFETRPGEMIEAVLEGSGQPPDENSFNSTFEVKPLFPAPSQTKPEPAKHKVERRASRTLGGSLSPYCEVHKCEKYKDGKTNRGVQKYRCPECKKVEPRNTVGQQKTGTRHRRRRSPLSGNPKCETCGQHMRVRGSWNGKRYYKCLTCPKKPKEQRDPGEELTAFVRGCVTQANGHDPQLRDDIVQELVTDVLAGKLKRKDIEKREIIRRYARSQARLRQNRHRDISIDQSRSDDEDGTKLKDKLKG